LWDECETPPAADQIGSSTIKKKIEHTFPIHVPSANVGSNAKCREIQHNVDIRGKLESAKGPDVPLMMLLIPKIPFFSQTC
jgi:hypothetical protein